MKTRELTLRCYGEEKNGIWSVVCIDLCLAAQADTADMAREKLELQIRDYICDALVGEDKEHSVELLDRKAPLSLIAKYYYIAMRSELHKHKEMAKSFLFTQSLPLKPC